MDELGVVLETLRRRRRWTMRTLSRKSGVPVATIYELECGTGPLDSESGRRLVQALVARDPTLFAMALLCCATFHAELGERQILSQLALSPVAGCA